MSTTVSDAAPGQLSHRQILTVLSGLMLGMLLAALDQTIMASAMKTIADQLHGQTIQAWATTAYLITATISTPLYGKLSDIYGRKPMYLAAISIFLLGSVLSGIANSMYELAAFRERARAARQEARVARFVRVDADGNGRIEGVELEGRPRLARLDGDGDGAVDAAEWAQPHARHCGARRVR